MAPTNGNQSIHIAFLIEQGFEDSEFQIPYLALRETGARVTVVGSRMNNEYHGKQGKVTVKPEATATEVRSEDFDLIVIPGGHAPDVMRTNPNMVRLIMDAMGQEKLIAAVCHGPQLLIEADQLRGRRATGFRAIRKDMQNAGATYIDEAVVVDGNLITARQPGDLPMFTTVILSQLGLSLKDTQLPDLGDRQFAWWKLGENWGGSSRGDIIRALETAIIGERYTLSEFRQYAERARDPELTLVLQEVCVTKERNLQRLEARLADFGERVTWQSTASEAYATLQNWLQANDNDQMSIVRRALGDLQTGVVDAFQISISLTDPITAEIFDEVEMNLALHEERLGDYYRARQGANVQPPMPTTMAGVG